MIWYFATRDRTATGVPARSDLRVLGAIAVGAPLLLTAAGWDKYRWGFLILTNFFVVMWIWLGDVRRSSKRQWVTVAVALLVVMQWGNLHYFDGIRAREIGTEAVGDFWTDLTDGTITTDPTTASSSTGSPRPNPTPDPTGYSSASAA